MDFCQIKERSLKGGIMEVYADFKVCRSKDLMVRGKGFYAIWNEDINMWSTDEYDVQHLVDRMILERKEEVSKKTDGVVQARLMSNFSSRAWSEFRQYMANISDNATQLDSNLTFLNSDVKKSDFVSKRLPYEIMEGDYNAWENLVGTLYAPEERAKLEWAIGAILSGDSKYIQKFVVLYGEAGTGKSTIIEIIQKLFAGYYTAFEAKAITANGNAFATEVFKSNPLVAIQHDGDLSRIEDNSKLNSIVAHEDMTMNEKYKPSYMSRINAFLFMGTNKPVKITDSKSGIIRRLLDVTPTGKRLSAKEYASNVNQIKFELGHIAHHCLETYREMGKNYYADYIPLAMMMKTDVFFNFVESQFYMFTEEDGISLKHAYDMYKTYCDESLIQYKSAKHKFREELKDYFRTFQDVARINGKQVRNYYSGFKFEKFTSKELSNTEDHQSPIVLDQTISRLDKYCANRPAQKATSNEIPGMQWDNVKTVLSDIDTSKVHYLRPDLNHIVLDFDLKDDTGKKSLALNLEAASSFPPTYTEVSKGGNGLHLHYIYDGDADKLNRLYDTDIEVKVFTGKSSLRRRLTLCNNTPIVTINSGLPVKEDKVLDFKSVDNEKHLRGVIKKCLRKEVHSSTKPSVDFILKILDDAYKSDMSYDVTDLRNVVLAFAMASKHQREICVKNVMKMSFISEDNKPKDNLVTIESSVYDVPIEDLVMYDVEVYPNLFVIVWSRLGSDKYVKMINPTAAMVGEVLKLPLVGFNNRRYDNHIMYAAYIGHNNDELYKLSKKIISNDRNCLFREAYGLSHADIYDYSSVQQSLKKWEIELGIHHMEMEISWDEPVPKKLWPKVVDYCVNDVAATKAVFRHSIQDYNARKLLAKLSHLKINDSTNRHAERIIFGMDKEAYKKFEYTDLGEKLFPGYKYERGKSLYHGEEVGEGGRVYAEPGMYGNVALLDVESMHPRSLILLNYFGPYTKRFAEIVEARLAIKHIYDGEAKVFNQSNYDLACSLLDGLLAPFLENIDVKKAKALSYALKLIINRIYGMTSAKFQNPFRDPRNVDNIVAKRGALFMEDLRKEVEARGYSAAHIKTDSIKIPNATPEIIEFVKEFGAKYGYVFDHEATYDKFCLVNNAVYIAKDDAGWHATGKQFAHPFIFKTLFTKEPLIFDDYVESKSVKTKMYIDDGTEEKHFVGKVGRFVPMKDGYGAGPLLREKDGNIKDAVTGTKGYLWLEADIVDGLNKEEGIDKTYYTELAEKAIANIEKFGDFAWFSSDAKYDVDSHGILPF